MLLYGGSKKECNVLPYYGKTLQFGFKKMEKHQPK